MKCRGPGHRREDIWGEFVNDIRLGTCSLDGQCRSVPGSVSQ